MSTHALWSPHDSATTRPRVLCVDDEPYVLDGLRDTLWRSFEVHASEDPIEALDILRQDPEGFAVVISDLRMPRMSGADFLREAALWAPYAVRILLTGQADLQSAIDAVNGARLFRYLPKPCDTSELLRACVAALGHHRKQLAERELLAQTLRASIDVLAEVLALTNPAAFGRASRLRMLVALLVQIAGIPDDWEVEVAAMLSTIGAVILPQSTVERLYAGMPLTHEETEMVLRTPAVTRQLLSKIPRLEGVLEILATYHDALPDRAADGSRQAPLGALALRIASDYIELEADGASKEVALGVMHNRGVYDRRLLQAFAHAVGLTSAAPDVRELALADLRAGMTLVADVRHTSGYLLVARGQRVTDRLVERLANLPPGSVRAPLRIADGAL